MNSGNLHSVSIVNNGDAQNNIGGSHNTNTQNISTPSAAVIAASSTVLPSVDENNIGFGQLNEDGCGPSKSKPIYELAGNLILRERDSSFSNNEPKAYALIINIFHYEPYYDKKTKTTEDMTRHGSQVDVENLAKKFKMFNVGVYTPKTHTVEENTVIYVEASDVKRWINDFKKKVTEHKNKSEDSKMACFVCIMGHGGHNACLIDSQHMEISMETEIFSKFNNQHFPAMIKNPKIFFTSCCRGNDPSPRVTGGLATDGISGASPTTVPNVEDFLIGWSTTPENFSGRNTQHGTIFIRILCQLLQHHLELLSLEMNKYFSGTAVAKNTDLETILKAVAVEMREYSYNYAGQSCSQTSNIDNRGFAHFRWLVDDFEYSRDGWLPSYLKLSDADRIKMKLS